MTVLESYKNVLTRLGKVKAASFYVEDFIIFLTNAIQDRCNDMYRNYEKTQLLSDDLQNLSRHIIIDIDDNVPFPFNIHYIDGTPFIQFYSSYDIESNGTFFNSFLATGLNPVLPINEYRNRSYNPLLNITRNSIFEIDITPSNPLDVLELGSIEDGSVISIKSDIEIRDYRLGDNTNYLSFGFNLYDQGTSIQASVASPIYFRYSNSTRMFNLIYGSGYTVIDDIRMLINTPNDYWHTTGITNILEYKNSIECENTLNDEIEVKRLTDQTRAMINRNKWLAPSRSKKNNYFKEMNNVNSVYPNLEIHYCSNKEKDLVTLTQIELQYLKEPIKYVLTDADVRSTNDTTQSLEFQDYICQEINEQIVTMLLEKNSNQRVQTFPLVNDSNKANREQQ